MNNSIDKIVEDRKLVMEFAKSRGKSKGIQLIFQNRGGIFAVIGKYCAAVGVVLPGGDGTWVCPETWEYHSNQTPQQFIDWASKNVIGARSPYKILDKHIQAIFEFGPINPNP